MAYKASNNKKPDPIQPPCKKTIYHTEDEARDMIRYIKENRNVREINVYRCTVCGFWHLTSRSV